MLTLSELCRIGTDIAYNHGKIQEVSSWKKEFSKHGQAWLTDSAVRHIVKIYPYDVAHNIDTTGDGEPDEGSLRGSSETVAERIRQEIQSKVMNAGIEVLDAKITYLAYATEIASVMLQRQQASAVVDARAMIVDGAVSIVDMALHKLEDQEVVKLDDEQKTMLASNLMVVLCGNRDVQPMVNSGSSK